MRFTNIRDLKYNSEDKSRIDLLATCQEYGEIPMTLVLTDTEDLHTFFDGKTEYHLEEYCKTQKIQEYNEALNKAKEDELKQTLEYKINEAKLYLVSTDYKMTVDYFATLSKEIQDELILKREEVREFIRANN